jgi:hypothetical protein
LLLLFLDHTVEALQNLQRSVDVLTRDMRKVMKRTGVSPSKQSDSLDEGAFRSSLSSLTDPSFEGEGKPSAGAIVTVEEQKEEEKEGATSPYGPPEPTHHEVPAILEQQDDDAIALSSQSEAGDDVGSMTVNATSTVGEGTVADNSASTDVADESSSN